MSNRYRDRHRRFLTEKVKIHMLYIMRNALSSKGQITIPIEVRKRLGLQPGTVVHFEVVEGGALLKKGARNRSPVEGVYGILRTNRSVDTIIDEMRGPRPTPRRR
jgi:AbrB family looped-hinge helix DNA binding protein